MSDTVLIVGIEKSNNGRSCELHKTCGETCVGGMIIEFKKCQVRVAGRQETAMSAVVSQKGFRPCIIGFLRKKDDYMWENVDKKKAIITMLLVESASDTDRCVSYKNSGAAICKLLI